MAIQDDIRRALGMPDNMLGGLGTDNPLDVPELTPDEQLLLGMGVTPQPGELAPPQGQESGFLDTLVNNPAASRALLQTGLGLLAANAPSTDPRSGDLGFVLSQGLGAGLQSLQQSEAIQRQEKQREDALRAAGVEPARKAQEAAEKKRAGELFGKLTNVKNLNKIPLDERADAINDMSAELSQLSPELAGKVLDFNLKREKEADALRGELDTKPEIKGFMDARVKTNQAQSALNDFMKKGGSAKGANAIAVDQIIINNLSKILDPGSVVRESEFARTAEGIALINKVIGGLQKLEAGGVGLTDKDRITVVEAMQSLRDQAEKPFNARVNQFEKIIDRRGFIREEILPPSIDEAPRTVIPSATVTPEGATDTGKTTKDGKRILKLPDGTFIKEK